MLLLIYGSNAIRIYVSICKQIINQYEFSCIYWILTWGKSDFRNKIGKEKVGLNFNLGVSVLACVTAELLLKLASQSSHCWWIVVNNFGQRTDYGTVDGTVAGEATVSVTRLVLTPTLTLNDPLSQNFTMKWHRRFKSTDSGNGNVYANYHR